MVEQYLRDKYNKTKFPFTSVVTLYRDMEGSQTRDECRAELNRLLEAGIIRRREGMVGLLIELVII